MYLILEFERILLVRKFIRRCRKMIIDLTTKIDDEIIEPWLAKEENRHIAMGHVGTHLDTYLKSEIPLEYFKRRGLVIDGSAYAEEREIGLEDIRGMDIGEGDFVIFRTDRIKKTYGTKDYFKDHPQLSQDLISHLCKMKVSFIGIDTAGIRRGEEHREADILCEENNIYVIENLTNLDKLKNENLLIYTMWLDDSKATGLRCRVIGEF